MKILKISRVSSYCNYLETGTRSLDPFVKNLYKFEHFLKCMYRLLICRGLALLTSAGSDGIIGRGRDDFTDARRLRPQKPS